MRVSTCLGRRGSGVQIAPPRPIFSPCLLESVFNSLGVTCDHSQEYPRRAIGPRSALFPVLQCRGLETEPRGKLRLAQTEAPPQRTYISRWNPNGGHPHRDIFTTGPGDRLLQTGYDLLTHAALEIGRASCRERV